MVVVVVVVLVVVVVAVVVVVVRLLRLPDNLIKTLVADLTATFLA